MKQKFLAMMGIIAILSLCLAGIVNAAKEGYGFQIATGAEITVDGDVGAGEWDDSYKDFLYNGWTMSTSFFRDKWGSAPSEGWLIEIPTDITSDETDIFKFSVDTLQDGGSAPQADDFLITITGHSGTVTMQQGTGTTWGASSAVSGTDYLVASSMASGHWVIEIYLDKAGALAMQYNNNVRIGTYDVSTGNALCWPPDSAANVPDTYGTGTTEFGDPIPEGLTIGVMILMSFVAVVVSTRYYRKRPKWQNW